MQLKPNAVLANTSHVLYDYGMRSFQQLIGTDRYPRPNAAVMCCFHTYYQIRLILVELQAALPLDKTWEKPTATHRIVGCMSRYEENSACPHILNGGLKVKIVA